jgi:hypothetical protein
MPRYKDDFSLGLEHILNNPNASFLKNPSVFHEIHNKAGMSLSKMVRHIGNKTKNKRSEPTDKERAEQRVGALEAKSETS